MDLPIDGYIAGTLKFRAHNSPTLPIAVGVGPSFTHERLAAKYGSFQGPYRIVVLEAPRLALALGRLFELMGHQAATADDGCAGLELIKSWEPHAVFSRIELPGLNGYEVAKEIRNSLPTRPLLIAYTGCGKWEIGERAKEAGFDLLLTKPAPIADLWRALSFIKGTCECDDLRL